MDLNEYFRLHPNSRLTYADGTTITVAEYLKQGGKIRTGLTEKPENALWDIMTQDEEFTPAIEQDDDEPEV